MERYEIVPQKYDEKTKKFTSTVDGNGDAFSLVENVGGQKKFLKRFETKEDARNHIFELEMLSDDDSFLGEAPSEDDSLIGYVSPAVEDQNNEDFLDGLTQTPNIVIEPVKPKKRAAPKAKPIVEALDPVVSEEVIIEPVIVHSSNRAFGKQFQIFRLRKTWANSATSTYEKWYNNYSFVQSEQARVRSSHADLGYTAQDIMVDIESSYVTMVEGL